MDVLVLSMTVGQGHNSASRALQENLQKKGYSCEILDTYKFLNRAIGEAFDKGYTVMGRFWPRLNENIYTSAERYNGRSDMKMYFPWLFADFSKAKLQKYIDEHKPKVIVCSIVMTAILTTLLRESKLIDESIALIGIVTDYSLHPFWEYTDMDYFVCPNELMIPSMRMRGIEEKKILPIGIPIHEKFSNSIEKKEACQKLGLKEDLFTVLLSAGGMGFTGLSEAVYELEKIDKLQIIAVCGTNKRLIAKLESMNFKNIVYPTGYIKNIDEYMDASDVVITKPGGLSTSEAIAKEKPLILTKPMPGVENMNLAFLVNNSLAIHSNKYQPVSEVLQQLELNVHKLDEMRRAQRKWGKKNSAADLGTFIETKLLK